MKTTVTLADIKKLPPISNERMAEIKAFKNTDFSDCPPLTDAELKEMKPVMLRNPDWYKPLKQDVHVTRTSQTKNTVREVCVVRG